MSRKATGTVRIIRGAWHARWTRADGTLTNWCALPGAIPLDDRARAKAEAARLAPKVRRAGDAATSTVETARDWFGRLHDAKEAKGLATVQDMRGRAERWVFPVFGDKVMREVTRKDGEALVAKLDAAVAAFMKQGPGKGRLSPSTAANVWGDVQHAFDEAVSAKDEGLRVLESSPLEKVRGPEGGQERQGQILYSDELVALLRGESAEPGRPGVPLYRRQTYAMAVYSKARASELEALTAVDVDLAHGTITIDKQADGKSKGRKGIKQTKTKRVRTVDVEPHLRRLLATLLERPKGKGGRLIHMPPPEDRAELLRKDLRTVGVARPALFIEGDPLQRAINFHDLRDTGLTHMAVRGDSPIVIQWAGGHTDFKTTQGYIARGQTERRRIGEPLPPLPPDLSGIDPELTRSIAEAPKPWKTSTIMATPTGIESPVEKRETAEDSADMPRSDRGQSTRLLTGLDRASPNDAERGSATDADLERAIVDAVTMGIGDVARTLAVRLEERRRATAGNVVAFRRAP